MNQIDIRVYNQFRKYPRLPEYETNSTNSFVRYLEVPILVVTPNELDMILALDYSDVIKEHHSEALLIVTDKRRVLAVKPEGYDYAKYVCTIDEETVRHILSIV